MGGKSQSLWAKNLPRELANWACVLHQFRWRKFRGRHSLVRWVGWGVLYWGAPALHRVCVSVIIFYNTIVHIGLWHLVRHWFSGHTEMLSYAWKMVSLMVYNVFQWKLQYWGSPQKQRCYSQRQPCANVHNLGPLHPASRLTTIQKRSCVWILLW